MTDVVFWQNQSSSCNPWLKENLKLLSSPSLIIQAERHLTNLLISTLVPYTGPAWLSRYPLLFSSSYSSDLVVSFATQHHVARLSTPTPWFISDLSQASYVYLTSCWKDLYLFLSLFLMGFGSLVLLLPPQATLRGPLLAISSADKIVFISKTSNLLLRLSHPSPTSPVTF